MNKTLILSTLAVLILLLAMTNCTTKKDPTPTPTPVSYSADYQFSLTGDYSNLKIEYMEPAAVKKELTAPALPWQANIADFNATDSVTLHITFDINLHGSVNYSWGVKVFNDSGILADDGDSDAVSEVTQIFPISIDYGYKLP